MLDRAVSLARRKLDVSHRDVVLKIDETLGMAPRGKRNRPEGLHLRQLGPHVDDRDIRRLGYVVAGRASGVSARRDAVGETLREPFEAARRTARNALAARSSPRG